MMHKITLALFLLISSVNLTAGEKDATFTACLDVVTNGLNNASEANQKYLIGKENGIEAGIRLAYKKHDIKNSLPVSTWPDTIDEACRVVIIDKTKRRSMAIFNEAVFKIYTDSK